MTHEGARGRLPRKGVGRMLNGLRQGLRRFRRWTGWAVAAVSLAVSALVSAAPAMAATRLTVGQSFVALEAIGAWVARDQGFFAKHGLDVEIVPIRGDTQGVQALLAGGVQLLLGGPSGGLAAHAAGADVVNIATLGPSMPYVLVVRPEVQRPEDLKGKRMGVSGTGLSSSRAAVMVALRSFGLDPVRDVTLIPSGTSSERVAAVVAGSIHATVLSTGQRARVERLAQEGRLRVLADLSELPLPWDHDVVMTTRRFIDSNRPVVLAFLKALVEANHFILKPENRETVVRVIGQMLEESQEGAEILYQFIPRTVVPKPYPSRDAAQAMVDALKEEFPELGRARVQEYVVTSLMEELDRSGFIASLR